MRECDSPFHKTKHLVHRGEKKCNEDKQNYEQCHWIFSDVLIAWRVDILCGESIKYTQKLTTYIVKIIKMLQLSRIKFDLR